MSKKPSFEEMKKIGEQKGVPNITEEEYNAHASDKWSIETGLHRIANIRKKKEEDANKKIEVWEGYPLGGRDYIYKKKDTDELISVEEAKTQRITYLREDGSIVELTQWGDFKGQHGRKSEVEVEIVETAGTERTFIDNRLRGITVRDAKITVPKLLSLAKPVNRLVEDDKYHYVILHGVIGVFESEPVWKNGEKAGEYPTNYNKVPCLNFVLKTPSEEGGAKVFCRCQLSPTKFSRPFITVPDFNEMIDAGIEEYNISFQGRKVVVAGWLRRYDPQADIIYANLMCTAVVSAEDVMGELMSTPPTKEKAKPKPDTKTKPLPNEPPKPTETPKSTAPATGAGEKLQALKVKVDEAYQILGDDLTLAAFKEIHGDTGVSDKIVETVIAKRKKDGSSP